VARRPMIAGNWKMNKGTAREASELAGAVAGLAADFTADVDVVVCPPYPALHATAEALQGSAVALGAQDCYWKSAGAYTGQVSPEMLVDSGVTYVVLGHSERRGRFGVPEPDFTEGVLKHFGETDHTVNLKATAAIAAGLKPIICVGETLAEREADQTDGIVAAQVEGALDGISAGSMASVVFAYEPVWAIGTGRTCSPDEADRVCGVIRKAIEDQYNDDIAGSVRILYGGSMKPDNAADLLVQPHIDGGLIGGASLKPADFAGIFGAAAAAQAAGAQAGAAVE